MLLQRLLGAVLDRVRQLRCSGRPHGRQEAAGRRNVRRAGIRCTGMRRLGRFHAVRGSICDLVLRRQRNRRGRCFLLGRGLSAGGRSRFFTGERRGGFHGGRFRRRALRRPCGPVLKPPVPEDAERGDREQNEQDDAGRQGLSARSRRVRFRIRRRRASRRSVLERSRRRRRLFDKFGLDFGNVFTALIFRPFAALVHSCLLKTDLR